MSLYIDTLPLQVFERLKKKFVTKTLLITPDDLNRVGVFGAYSGPEEYVRQHFKVTHNVEITRYRHDYKSLDGPNPQLGVVFLANDSVIIPGLEAWVLLDHNARYLEKDMSGGT